MPAFVQEMCIRMNTGRKCRKVHIQPSRSSNQLQLQWTAVGGRDVWRHCKSGSYKARTSPSVQSSSYGAFGSLLLRFVRASEREAGKQSASCTCMCWCGICSVDGVVSSRWLTARLGMPVMLLTRTGVYQTDSRGGVFALGGGGEASAGARGSMSHLFANQPKAFGFVVTLGWRFSHSEKVKDPCHLQKQNIRSAHSAYHFDSVFF